MAALGRRRVAFYYDFISHNAALAHFRLQRLAAQHNLHVELQPVLFAALLKAHNQVGPAEVPPKNWWMIKNVLRKAALDGLPPLQPPVHHPFRPLLTLRTASMDWGSHEANTSVTTALFQGVWMERMNPMDVEEVASFVSRGLQAAAKSGAEVTTERVSAEVLAHMAAGQEVKDGLAASTSAAVEAGVFGVPTFRVFPAPQADANSEPELFFGYDDMNLLELFLQGKDPISGADLSAWKTISGFHRPESPLSKGPA